MSFPKRLRPLRKRKILSINEKFIDNQMLARYHDINDGGSIFLNNQIDTSLIDYKRFPGLSCNYLPPSSCEDLKIIYHNVELLKEWLPENGEVEIDNSDFEIDNSREVYKFSMDSIIEEKLPYEIDDKSHWIEIKIIHKPLVGNFFHCEFQLVASHKNGDTLTDLSMKRNYQKVLIANLRRLLELHSEPCNNA